MKLGILAYGSLIDNPGAEIEAVTTAITRGVWTPFPVEFARSSGTRGNAPTLVPVIEGGANVAAIIYHVATGEKNAADILYRREIHEVGTDRTYKEPSRDRQNAVRIERFNNFEGYDVVLSTRISATISPLSAGCLAELAIASVKSAPDGKDGISYLIAAKAAGIVTALSPAYEAEILKRVQVDTLSKALVAIQQSLVA